MEGRRARLALVTLAVLLLATVPQTLVAHVTMESPELGFRDEYVLVQWRLDAAAWALGGVAGYALYCVAMAVPMVFAFFPRLRRLGTGATGLLLGVAFVATGAPKVFLAGFLVLLAGFLPERLAFAWPRPARV